MALGERSASGWGRVVFGPLRKGSGNPVSLGSRFIFEFDTRGGALTSICGMADDPLLILERKCRRSGMMRVVMRQGVENRSLSFSMLRRLSYWDGRDFIESLRRRRNGDETGSINRFSQRGQAE